jgi:7-keto-8-aminopelargonate synthetase-like enzyme
MERRSNGRWQCVTGSIRYFDTASPALNSSFNFIGLSGNEEIKEQAVETQRKYGSGSCGPPGFYSTLGVYISHVK